MGFGFEIVKIHRPGGPLEAVEVRARAFSSWIHNLSEKQEIEKSSDFKVLQRASWTVDFDNFKAKTH